jgi:hypothetical protein
MEISTVCQCVCVRACVCVCACACEDSQMACSDSVNGMNGNRSDIILRDYTSPD